MEPIFETKYFLLTAKEKTEVDRLDGGHIVIRPKRPISDRTELTRDEAIDLVRLTINAGKAFVLGMRESAGVEISRINYQDNGNWTPSFHIHLYGRAKNAKWQKFGDPIIAGNKPEYQPLIESDCEAIRRSLLELYRSPENSDEYWGVK